MSEIEKVVEFLELATPRQLQSVLATAATSRKSESSKPVYSLAGTPRGELGDLSLGLQQRRSTLSTVRRQWTRMLSRSN